MQNEVTTTIIKFHGKKIAISRLFLMKVEAGKRGVGWRLNPVRTQSV